MINQLIEIVIWLVIIGFAIWAIRALVSIIPMEPIVAQAVNVLILIVAGILVLLKVVIPLLHMVAGITVSVGGLH